MVSVQLNNARVSTGVVLGVPSQSRATLREHKRENICPKYAGNNPATTLSPVWKLSHVVTTFQPEGPEKILETHFVLSWKVHGFLRLVAC